MVLLAQVESFPGAAADNLVAPGLAVTMADPRPQASRLGSSALLPAGHDADSRNVRPRNRRLLSTENNDGNGNGDGGLLSAAKSTSSLFSSFSAATSRNASPGASVRSQINQETRSASNPPPGHGPRPPAGDALGLLETSLTQGWSSFQGFASSLISGESGTAQPGLPNGRPKPLKRDYTAESRNIPKAWGPSPQSDSRPGVNDVGAGSLAERQAALKAARMASVLESHEGVNGGLDVTGKYKRRTSDDLSASAIQQEATEDQLVYIHHVQPTNTYAGIVLKYRCREDAFRRTNGLWSRDIQWRKWLALPVDFCEVRGRACEPPFHLNKGNIDHLAPTPEPLSNQTRAGPATDSALSQGDFFSLSRTNSSKQTAETDDATEKPWTHVRWCSLDSFHQPVEIARISKKTIGYFPPRRKKSVQTVSSLSTPRHSLDASVTAGYLADSPDRGSAAPSSRRPSTLSSRPGKLGTPGSPSTSSRSRVDSAGTDNRPTWMRRPGGVGSMGRNARAPGPEQDIFNTWATRHLPGIAVNEYLPSISVMGSETAHLGFDRQQESEAAAIVESPFDDGQDLTSTSRQGSGLDRAAAQVETWLRGAFMKRPGTPQRRGAGNGCGGRDPGRANDPDLIELTDAGSDDGPMLGTSVGSGAGGPGGGLLDPTNTSSPIVTGRTSPGAAVPTSRGSSNFAKGHKSE